MPVPYNDRQMKAGEVDGRAQVLIPSDWEGLSVKHRCAIASQLSGMTIMTALQAGVVIRAELRRRG